MAKKEQQVSYKVFKRTDISHGDINSLKGCSLTVIVKTVISFIIFAIAIPITKYILFNYYNPQNFIKNKNIRCAVNKILDPASWVSHVSLFSIFILQFFIVDIQLTNYMIKKNLDYHTIKTNQRILRLFVVGIFSGLTWELIRVRCEEL